MESRHAGFDIGMDRAIREWLHKHYTAWAAAPLRLPRRSLGEGRAAKPRLVVGAGERPPPVTPAT